MKINSRLKLIGDLVSDNSTVLDVGCDHAFLDIYLETSDRGIKAIASDIAPGPLEQAKANIKREKLEGKIEVRLGNGLDTYSDDIDTVIIAGMGGRNMIGIFKNNLKKLKKIQTLILSPNNYQEDVKKFLCKTGFYIEDEEFVREKKFIYQVLVFKRGHKSYTKRQMFFGPIFLIKKGDLFLEYYAREHKSREIMLEFLPKRFRLKRYQLKKELKLIEKELES